MERYCRICSTNRKKCDSCRIECDNAPTCFKCTPETIKNIEKGMTIIVGKGASGKNELLKRMENKGKKHLVSHTTREMRNGETDGVEYHFITKEVFNQMIKKGLFVEYQEFNGNLYGTSIMEWMNSDVSIMAPTGIENIKKLGILDKCFVLYLDIPYRTRLNRLLNRFECVGDREIDNVLKRMSYDEVEFDNFTDYDILIQNDNF